MKVKISSESFEISPWMKTFIEKKSQRLGSFGPFKDVSISWRLMKHKGMFETRMDIMAKGRPIYLVKQSRDFKTTVDQLIDCADKELSNFKDKVQDKIHRKKQNLCYDTP